MELTGIIYFTYVHLRCGILPLILYHNLNNITLLGVFNRILYKVNQYLLDPQLINHNKRVFMDQIQIEKIKDLIEQCKYYSSVVKEKITLEYVMLRGINDSTECAKQLIKLMAQFPCKVNLIEFNPWPGVQYLPTERSEMEKFGKVVQEAGYVATIRRSRGQDILGACGQLRTESEKKKNI